jgi:hypothetical protein
MTKSWAASFALILAVGGPFGAAGSGSPADSAATSAVPRPGPPGQTEWGEIPRPVVTPEAPADSGDTSFGPPESWIPEPPERPALPDVLPFGVGEHLKFSINYGIINAGHATMSVRHTRRIAGHECIDIRTEAKSNSFFSKIYKVWDRAQTFVDRETILPRRFEKHLREGTYRKDVIIKFDRGREIARYQNGDEIVTHAWAQDELSAFYYVRTLPLVVGQDVFIDNHTNRKNYPLKVIVHRRETVTVGAGTFDCFVIEPVIKEGGIFSAKGTLTIWMTDDERRMPVKMRTKVAVGSITASLTDYRLGEQLMRKVS